MCFRSRRRRSSHKIRSRHPICRRGRCDRPARLRGHLQRAREPRRNRTRYETRSQGREVNLGGTEVVKDRRAAIEQRFNVDELPRPVPLPEDALTKGKATWPQFFRIPRSRKVVGAGDAKHCAVNRGRGRKRAPRFLLACLQGDQDLSEFHPPVRPDDDRLASLESRAAIG